MLALADLRADACRGCGAPLSETTAKDAEGRYAVGPPHRCHRCTAIAEKQDSYKDAPHGHALLWTAKRR